MIYFPNLSYDLECHFHKKTQSKLVIFRTTPQLARILSSVTFSEIDTSFLCGSGHTFLSHFSHHPMFSSLVFLKPHKKITARTFFLKLKYLF